MPEELEMFGLPNKKYVAQNAVPDDKKRLLTTGAILIYSYAFQGWTPQTLKINPLELAPEYILAEFWNTNNREQADKLIEDLIKVGGFVLTGETKSESREQVDGRLRRYAEGDKTALSGEESQMLDDITEWMIGFKWIKTRIQRSDMDNIGATLAWDIERAAFVARLAYNSGYYSEEEVWDILAKTRSLAETNFESWLEYAISFMKGISIAKCDSDFTVMCGLWDKVGELTERKWGDVWAWSPLK